MKNNIELTCVADGKKMDFISAVDLYTILGNVIDNAIESVLMVSDEDEKSDFHIYLDQGKSAPYSDTELYGKRENKLFRRASCDYKKCT